MKVKTVTLEKHGRYQSDLVIKENISSNKTYQYNESSDMMYKDVLFCLWSVAKNAKPSCSGMNICAPHQIQMWKL
jgi:hypothetical protein